MNADFNTITIDEIRIKLVEQADDIHQHLRALDELETHLNPVMQVAVIPKAVEPEFVSRQLHITTGDELEFNGYAKAYEMKADGFVVGHMARQAGNKWEVWSTGISEDDDIYDHIGCARGKSNALDLLMSHYAAGSN